MSVSVTLIPVALALRVVMGKEKFDNWVESLQSPQESIFSSRKKLITALHGADYDALPYGTLIKTHFGKNNFFFWELREGKWVAVFSKYDEQEDIDELDRKLSEVVGKPIFSAAEIKEIVQKELPSKLPTNFNDIGLLEEVLKKENIPFTNEGGVLKSELGDVTLSFVQAVPNGIIDVQFDNQQSSAEVYKQVSSLDESYRYIVQQTAYNKVLSEAENYGFTIESETVLANESILLTLNIHS